MESRENFHLKNGLDENNMAISLTRKIINDLQATVHISSLKIEYLVNKVSTDPKLSDIFNEINSLPFYCYISQKMCLFLKLIKSHTLEFVRSLYNDISSEGSSESISNELSEIKEMLETKNYEDLEAIEKYLENFYSQSQEVETHLTRELDITVVKKNGEIETSPNRFRKSSVEKIDEKISQQAGKLEVHDLEKIESSFVRGFPDETHRSSAYLGDSTINKKKSLDDLYSVEVIPVKFKGKLILT